jgi:hypothetical protein
LESFISITTLGRISENITTFFFWSGPKYHCALLGYSLNSWIKMVFLYHFQGDNLWNFVSLILSNSLYNYSNELSEMASWRDGTEKMTRQDQKSMKSFPEKSIFKRITSQTCQNVKETLGKQKFASNLCFIRLIPKICISCPF